jgi:NADPH:quinone reductase-like Zn-dependent oxidoreductase
MKRWMMTADVRTIAGLTFEDAPIPDPAFGEVRIRVHAVSLNARDHMVIRGPFGRMPGQDVVPASDMAGVIDALGAGVAGWAVGDRVVNLHFNGWSDGPFPADAGFGLGSMNEDGVLSEYITLAASRIARAPASLNHAQASTLPCAAVTAWNSLFGDHPVGTGDKVLILGTGGVALFALQFAQAIGARVSAISRSDAKLARLEAMGLEFAVNQRMTANWGAEVARLTGGVNKVVDTIGTSSMNQSLAATAYGGEVAMVGLFSMGDASPDMGLFGKSLRGIAVGPSAMYEALATFIDHHEIVPVIHQQFPFDQAKDAFHAQLAPDLLGKIVINVAAGA